MNILFATQRQTFFISLIVVCVASIAAILFVPTPTYAAVDRAESFIFPMRIWNLSTTQGEDLRNGTYHMGVDLGDELGEGAPVYAIGDGVVKEVRERTLFGLVVLIEHTLPDGSKDVSLYGHLKPIDQPVSVGQSVKMGQRIGSLGNRSENGGWVPHLHFGIRKGGYSPVWIYYGHVPSLSTVQYWHDPYAYIIQRLSKDNWNPALSLIFPSNMYSGNQLRFFVDAQDVGSGVKSVKVELSRDNRATWTEIKRFSVGDSFPYGVVTNKPDIDGGNSYIKVTVWDNKGRSTQKVVRLTRDMSLSTTIGAVVMKNYATAGLTHVTYQSGGVERVLTPYPTSWSRGADVATGDVNGDGQNEIVYVKSGPDAIVTILKADGTLLSVFKAFPYKLQNDARVAVGDVNGDGEGEIVVGFGKGNQKMIFVFNDGGQKIGEIRPFKELTQQGIDVATGDVNGDGVDEIIASTRGSKKKTRVAVLTLAGQRLNEFTTVNYKYTAGVNVATGDVNGDGKDEILIGAQKYGKNTKGQVIVADALNNKAQRTVYTPFGSGFAGSIDVASRDTNGDGKDEIMMSQASGGPAIVKTYRFDAGKTVVSDERVFDAGNRNGARIAGWR